MPPVLTEPDQDSEPGPVLTRARQAGPVVAGLVAGTLVVEWLVCAAEAAFKLGGGLVDTPGPDSSPGETAFVAVLAAGALLLLSMLPVAAGSLLRRARVLATLPVATRVTLGMAAAGNLAYAIAALTGVEDGGPIGAIIGVLAGYCCLLLVRVRPDAAAGEPGRVRRRTVALVTAGLLVADAAFGVGGYFLARELAAMIDDPLDMTTRVPAYALCGATVDEACARKGAAATGVTVAWLGTGDGVEPRYLVARTVANGPVVFEELRISAIGLTLTTDPQPQPFEGPPGPPDRTVTLPGGVRAEIRHQDAMVRLDWRRGRTAYRLDAIPLGFLEDVDPDRMAELAGRVRYEAPPRTS